MVIRSLFFLPSKQTVKGSNPFALTSIKTSISEVFFVFRRFLLMYISLIFVVKWLQNDYKMILLFRHCSDIVQLLLFYSKF